MHTYKYRQTDIQTNRHTDRHAYVYTVFQKKTSTHIIGYKLGNSCLILIIFDNKITHII